MKSIITTIALSLVVCFASAQKVKEAEVPATVKDAFAKKYAGAKVEKWEKENGDFEAEFDWNKAEMSALFDATGTFKEEETEIKTAALPAGAKDHCTKNYAGWKIDEASKITDASGKVSYEAEIEKGKEEMELFFDESGTFTKKGEAEKDGDKDDD